MKNTRLMPRPFGETEGCEMMDSEEKGGVARARDDGVHFERPPPL